MMRIKLSTPRNSGQSKVSDRKPAICIAQDVFWLQISVDYVLGVELLQPCSYIGREGVEVFRCACASNAALRALS
jgi:hypothetical protein